MRALSRQLGCAALGGLIVWTLVACGERSRMGSVSAASDPAEAQARRTQGVALVQRMSEKIAAAPAMTFSTAEVVERVRKNGKKVTLNLIRELAVRRPDRLWFKVTGDQDLVGYYEGIRMTLVSNEQKVWGEFPTPLTLDETVDFVTGRYDIPLPIGDLLVVNPREAMVSDDTTGGVTGRETIDGVACEHIVWHHPKVDWSVWIPISGDPLPKKLRITYKERRGQPTTTVVFRDWNLTPNLTDAVFVRSIPDDYEGIPVIQRAAAVLKDEKGKTEPPQK